MNEKSCGIGIGSVIAVVVSWSQWHSVLWALIHGFFGWFYLLFWALGACDSRPL